MAERRMFSKTVIDSDVFSDMPLTTQALYFHLGMRADDDGFVNNPKKMYCVCDEYEEIGKFLDNHPEKKELFTPQKLINQYRAYLWNLKRLSDELKPEFLTRFSNEFQFYFYKGELNKEFFKSIKKKDLELLAENKDKFLKNLDKKFSLFGGRKNG